MDKEVLKKKLLELYSQPPGYYLFELAERFDVHPREILRAIKELSKEGKFCYQ